MSFTHINSDQVRNTSSFPSPLFFFHLSKNSELSFLHLLENSEFFSKYILAYRFIKALNLSDHSTKFESFRNSGSLAYCENSYDFTACDKLDMSSSICVLICNFIPFSQLLGSCHVLSTFLIIRFNLEFSDLNNLAFMLRFSFDVLKLRIIELTCHGHSQRNIKVK